MNFNDITQNSGELPESVPWYKILAYSVFVREVKTEFIDSPVIEMIDMRITDLDKKIEDRILLLENRVDVLTKRLERLVAFQP